MMLKQAENGDEKLERRLGRRSGEDIKKGDEEDADGEESEDEEEHVVNGESPTVNRATEGK